MLPVQLRAGQTLAAAPLKLVFLSPPAPPRPRSLPLLVRGTEVHQFVAHGMGSAVLPQLPNGWSPDVATLVLEAQPTRSGLSFLQMSKQRPQGGRPCVRSYREAVAVSPGMLTADYASSCVCFSFSVHRLPARGLDSLRSRVHQSRCSQSVPCFPTL